MLETSTREPIVIRQLLLLTLSMLLMSPVWATPSPVQRYFQDLQSLRADFIQRVFDERSRVVQSSSGQMLMQKPGKFRWDYRTPAEQIIVADGNRLWAYDVDLAQVTVRKLDKALGSTPLALLSGAFQLFHLAAGDVIQIHQLLFRIFAELVINFPVTRKICQADRGFVGIGGRLITLAGAEQQQEQRWQQTAQVAHRLVIIHGVKSICITVAIMSHSG